MTVYKKTHLCARSDKGGPNTEKIKSIEGGGTSKYFVYVMCSIKTMLSVYILLIASKKYFKVKKYT